MSQPSKKRVLLVSLAQWPHICRLPKYFNQAGFSVATFSPEEDSLNLSQYIEKRYCLRKGSYELTKIYAFFSKTLLEFEPDLIVATDDDTVRLLSDYYYNLSTNTDHDSEKLIRMLVQSKGNPAFYQSVSSKILSNNIARELSIRTPIQATCSSIDDAIAFAEQQRFPLVLKNEFGFAGREVKICATVQQLIQAYNELDANKIKLIQRYINATPAMCDAAVLDGNLLASFVTIKEETSTQTGPSTVVRLVEHPEMMAAVRKFSKHTGFSGILSLDFMIDRDNNSYFLECNPRPSPASHLGYKVHCDLFSALHGELSQQPYQAGEFEECTVALFPKELLRDINSNWVNNVYHDVPWDEPQLVSLGLKSIAAEKTTVAT